MKAIIFVIAVAGLFIKGHAQSEQFKTSVGEKFPKFFAADIDETIHTVKYLEGKPSLILFFGTRCPPCLQEVKHLK